MVDHVNRGRDKDQTDLWREAGMKGAQSPGFLSGQDQTLPEAPMHLCPMAKHPFSIPLFFLLNSHSRYETQATDVGVRE